MQRLRQQWFESGRRSPDIHSTAWHLFQAQKQLNRIPFIQRQPKLMPGVAPDAAPQPTTGSWQFAGPLPLQTSGSTDGGQPAQDYGDVTGRISALALDPADASGNTLFVGTASGGLWKCTNALSNPACSPLTDDQPSLSIGAIAINVSTNPETIIVGTGEPDFGVGERIYGDGILVSSDGGKSWSDITSATVGAGLQLAGQQVNLFGLGFTRILIDPKNPQIIIATAIANVPGLTGGGTPTSFAKSNWGLQGIYRSTDGGATWTLVSYGAPATDLAYNPATSTYYAAYDFYGLYQSTDQGATWQAMPSPFPSGTKVSIGSDNFTTNFAFVKLAVRNGTLYSLIVQQGGSGSGDLSAPLPCTSGQTSGCDTGIQQSTDGGQTWTPIAVPAVNAANATLMCEKINTGLDCQGEYDAVLMAPPGSTALYVAGLDGYVASAVSGLSTSWSDVENAYTAAPNLVHGDNHAAIALNSTTWYLGTDGGAWLTQDAASSWSNLNATLGVIQFYTVSADPTSAGVWLSGSQDNGTSKSAAGGTAWARVFEGDGGFTAINPQNEQQYFVEYPGDIYRYDNAADTMANDPSVVVTLNATKDAEAFIEPYHLLPHNPAEMIMGTCRVWEGPSVTTSDGAGWSPISNDLTGGGSSSGTCQNNSDYIRDLEAASTSQNPTVDSVAYVVTTDDHVAVTQNLNQASPTWTDVSANGLPQDGTAVHPFNSVAIDPSNPAVAYVAVEGFGDGHVFKTSNYGASWTDITGNLPDAPANWIIVDPLQINDIYVATDAGVFVATDGGVSGEIWQQLGSGLPHVPAMQITISPVAPRQVGIATFGRGVWTIATLYSGTASNAPDFTLALSPAKQSLASGKAASLGVSTTALDGDKATVTLSCTVPSSGCTFSPATVTPGGTSTLTIAASALTAGNNAITVSATDGTNTHTASAVVIVYTGVQGSLGGNLVAVAGGGATPPAPAPVAFKQAQIFSPTQLAIDPFGNVYFLDQSGAMIEKYDPQAGTVTQVAGCYQNNGGCGVGPSASQAQLATNIDLWSNVDFFNSPITLNGAQGLAVDPYGFLYIADTANTTVDVVAPDNDRLITIAGCIASGANCPTPTTNAESATIAGFGRVQALAVDANDDVFVADNSNNEIDEITAAAGGGEQIQVIAGSGQNTITTSPQAATSVTLTSPANLALDGQGNLYITFTGPLYFGPSAVAKLNLASGQIQLWAGDGFNSASSTAQAATTILMNPAGIAADAAGNLYISTTNDTTPAANQVLRVDTSDNLTLIAGSGGSATSYTSQVATSTNIKAIGLGVDFAGSLYMADITNNYLAEIQANGASPNTMDFSLAFTPQALTVAAGGTATLTLNSTAVSGDPVWFGVGCTAPATGCSFSLGVLSPGQSSTLTVAASALKTGANTVTVLGSDGTHTHTATATVTESVPADFTLALAPASQNVASGASATLTVTTTAVNGDTAPITLSCTAPASGCSFSPAKVAPGGSSTLTVAASALTTGSNTITVSAADGTNTHTASAAVTVTAPPGFAVSASPGSASVSPGQSASYTITATPSNGFNTAIALACSGLPSEAACSFSPASVTPSGAAVTSTLSISTTAPSLISPPPDAPGSTPLVPFVALSLAALLGLGLLLRENQCMRRFALGGALAATLLLAAACGGGGGGTAPPPPPQTNPGTAAGTYTVTITGNSAGASQTTTVTLTVN